MNHAIEEAGHTAAHTVAKWVPPMARAGYAAKGVVYALVGGIAIRTALAAGGPEGAVGALATLAGEHAGRVLLVVIAVGLGGHVVWRLVQALLDPEHPHAGAKRIGIRLFYAVSAIVYGSLAATAWQLGRGDRAEEDGHEGWVARLLQQPSGTWLVMLAGLFVMGYGVHQLAKAWRGDVNRHMGTRDAALRRGVTLLGRIGTAARGLVLLPIGWFVLQAGRHYRAAVAADTGEVLKMLEHEWLVAAVGVGLLAYGLHQVAKALFRHIERPD